MKHDPPAPDRAGGYQRKVKKMNTRRIAGVLIAALLMAGCVGPLQTQRIHVNIGFDPVIGHDTRADESIPFPTDRTFNVWAVNESEAAIYINDETVSYDSDGWTASKTWPQAMLSFEAYSPSGLGFEFSRDGGMTLKDFDCSKGDVDILVAKADNADMNTDSLVTMTFDHVLSRVEFRMLQSLSSEMQVKVRKIEMIGFASRGTFNSSKEEPWTPGAKDFSYVVFEDADGVATSSEPIYLGNEFYTIPQLCRARIELTFDIKYGEAAWIPQVEVIEELDTYWEPSTHYTYTLNLTESKLTYTTGISSWNNRE